MRRARSRGEISASARPSMAMRAFRRQQSGQRADQRGLAGAVRSDQRGELARAQREVRAADDRHAAEPDADALRLQDRGS